MILSKCKSQDIKALWKLRGVSRRMRRLVEDESLWRQLTVYHGQGAEGLRLSDKALGSILGRVGSACRELQIISRDLWPPTMEGVYKNAHGLEKLHLRAQPYEHYTHPLLITPAQIRPDISRVDIQEDKDTKAEQEDPDKNSTGPELPNLREMKICGYETGHTTLQWLLDHSPSLQMLKLSKLDVVWKGHGIPESTADHLRTLVIEDVSMNPEGPGVLLALLPRLTSLFISAPERSWDWRRSVKELCPKLVDLGWNVSRIDGVVSMIHRLLDLRNLYLGPNVTASAVAKLQEELPHIQVHHEWDCPDLTW